MRVTRYILFQHGSTMPITFKIHILLISANRYFIPFGKENYWFYIEECGYVFTESLLAHNYLVMYLFDSHYALKN